MLGVQGRLLLTLVSAVYLHCFPLSSTPCRALPTRSDGLDEVNAEAQCDSSVSQDRMTKVVGLGALGLFMVISRNTSCGSGSPLIPCVYINFIQARCYPHPMPLSASASQLHSITYSRKAACNQKSRSSLRPQPKSCSLNLTTTNQLPFAPNWLFLPRIAPPCVCSTGTSTSAAARGHL